MTVITVPIMDKLGRRVLLLYPMIVMTIIMGIITAAINQQNNVPWLSYISIACVIGYVICFAVGLGPIPWMIGAEIFRQGPRPRAMSIAGATNWLFTTIVALTFELIQRAIAEFTFIIFMILMIGFCLFVFFLVPETKNKTFEEIASLFAPGGNIEVEEIVEDDSVFQQGGNGAVAGEEIPEDEQLMTGMRADRQRNGSVDKDRGDAEVRVKLGGKDEERMSLTKSQEAINVDV
jgi:MFS family permease